MPTTARQHEHRVIDLTGVAHEHDPFDTPAGQAQRDRERDAADSLFPVVRHLRYLVWSAQRLDLVHGRHVPNEFVATRPLDSEVAGFDLRPLQHSRLAQLAQLDLSPSPDHRAD